MKSFVIREIEEKDDKAVEAIIRSCLKEFGADHAGTAWADPDLGRFSAIYGVPGARYWVAEDGQGRLLGGAGIGPLAGEAGVCELQKMYCLPPARGTGAAHALMQTALDYASRHYRRCYLETLDNMTAAQKFYLKYGFQRLPAPLGHTGHIACQVCMARDL